MPNGLLFILLGVMWAFVLVPMWMRKHDQASETKSADRFARALGSLGGRLDSRETAMDDPGSLAPTRAVVMPGRPKGAQGPRVTVTGPAAHASAVATPAATRRRRLLLGLLVATGAVLVAALLHRLPLWAIAVPVVLTVALLVNGRRQAGRTAEVARRRQHRAALTEAARVAEARYEKAPRARRGARAMMPATVAADIAAPGWMADPVVEAPLAPGAWHAVPTTLPTYVTAPAATRVPRNIDLSTPGSWTGAAMVEQARTSRHEEPADDSGMRVESFEIAVPRDRVADAYAAHYVDTSAGASELAAIDDDDELSALLDDPRTGVSPQRSAYRRAAG